MASAIANPAPSAYNLDQLKENLFQDLRYRLGDGIVDVELDPVHFEAAYRYAVKVYRQRAQNSTAESYTLMEIHAHTDTYTLPAEFINVRQVFRRTVGLETGPSSSSFDPFSSAILNTYLLNYNYAGGLATYDFYAGYIELAARMFGGYVIYTFDPVTKLLRLVRDPKASGEKILIWADVQRPEEVLLQDPGAGVWLGDWTLSQLKMTLGEAREKFASIAGPAGGTSLNGSALKAEGKAMQDQLLMDLKNFVDYSQPYSLIIG
jgi:hypothetical protein